MLTKILGERVVLEYIPDTYLDWRSWWLLWLVMPRGGGTPESVALQGAAGGHLLPLWCQQQGRAQSANQDGGHSLHWGATGPSSYQRVAGQGLAARACAGEHWGSPHPWALGTALETGWPVSGPSSVGCVAGQSCGKLETSLAVVLLGLNSPGGLMWGPGPQAGRGSPGEDLSCVPAAHPVAPH